MAARDREAIALGVDEGAARVKPADGAAGPARERLLRWVEILSAYFTAQTLVQVAGLAAGLVFVNLMPVREFALYAMASAVIGFLGFASDLGSTSSLLHFFHKTTGSSPEGFAVYFAAVLSLRRWAFLFGAIVVVVFFPLTALAEGFSAAEALLVAAGILLAVWFQISASLEVLALRLEDRYGQSYRAEMLGAWVRLLLASILGILGWLRAALAVLVAALGSAVVALTARRGVAPVGESEQLASCRREILRYLLPTLPGALYFSVQGPLIVWLAATFGSARNIAEVGALGRLGLVVGLCSGLTGVIFLPRLSRITDDRLYLTRYAQYGGALVALGASLLGAAALQPELFLRLIGPNYAGLQRELLLVVVGAVLSLLGGYAVAVNNARAWTRWQSPAVLVLALSQAALAATLSLETTMGLVTFNLLSAAVGLLVQLAIASVGFRRPDWVRWSWTAQ